ncbi:ABC transporter permease [Acidilobus sp.]|uniref:ABC transporter permease n=1 Tax=Acidilobus sp. TaxID=1872109 RepID=UPI003CFDEB8A
MSEEAGSSFTFYLKYVLKSKSALAALVIIFVFVGLAAYVSTWPKSVAFNYINNLQYWESAYPTVAAPSWMAALSPSGYAPSLYVNPHSMKVYEHVGTVYVYELTYSFDWHYSKVPTDVVFNFASNTTMQYMLVEWVKPSGSTVNATVTVTGTAYSFDLSALAKPLSAYLLQKTGTAPTVLTTQALATALFSNLSRRTVGPTELGTYKVNVFIATAGPAKFKVAQVRVMGNAYGALGTDIYGRPIFLGILLGLPNALEIGVVTSLLGVLIGAFVGGYAGFLGGKTDTALNWFSTVILSLPALPFLVALGLLLKSGLSIMEEALLITFLSWPFYAIIARSAAQSIKTNSFVEADKLMGIPSYRTFLTHFLPRLVPFIVAYTVLGIPGAILLVETLAFIGIAPPNIVTWGGILDAAYNANAALNGWWWWILFPGLMIVFVSLPFVVVGFVIERASFGGR